MLRIYDASNYYRMKLERNVMGLAPREILSEVFSNAEDAFIFVWDGPGNNRRRREIFPDYKMKRKSAGEDIYAGMDLLQKALRHSKAIQIKVPGYEGDDVIATLARHYAGTTPIGIYSNDFDYYQLTVLPHVYTGCRPLIENPSLVRTFKTFVGDPSDNIPGVRLFGEKSWEVCDQEACRGLLEKLDQEEALDEDLLEAARLPKSCIKWIRENTELVLAMYRITGFFDVPRDLIDKHMRIGAPDYPAADAVLKEYLQ